MTTTYTGTLRVHPRGFGFIEHTEGSVFAPGKLLKGLIDADEVTCDVPDGGDAADSIKLISRTRDRIVCDVENGKLIADRGCAIEVTYDIPNGMAFEDGDAVLYSITNELILSELGDRLSDNAVAVRMYTRHRLPLEHGNDAKEEATQIHPKRDKSGRRDHTGECVITIDAPESKDLDDALSAATLPDGNIRVWVHIADVAEYVKPSTEIDRAARACPTSVYLPQLVRHMLPEHLAANALSLVPNEDRDTVCVEMSITPEGDVRSVDVYEALIRSNARLSYVEVGEMITGAGVHENGDIQSTVSSLHAAACRLSVSRQARGGVDAWRTDSSERHGKGESAAHQLIERLMVACNEAVACWLADRSMPVIYRSHPSLDAEQALELRDRCAEFGMNANLGENISPRSFATLALLADQADRNLQFWDAAMSVMPRATYSCENSTHFGLGSTGYCHFTSPLRRYADLLVHRVVKKFLDGEREASNQDMREMSVVINDVARRADMAERDGTRAQGIAKLRRGSWHDGVIVGRQGRAWRVQIEGVSGTLMAREGESRIGEKVRVRISKAEALLGLLEFREDDGDRVAHKRGTQPKSAQHRRAGNGTKVTRR
jgi:ribonuclease R